MKVRTTMRPDVDVEVDDHEANELRLQGLLVEEPSKVGEKTAKQDKEN